MTHHEGKGPHYYTFITTTEYAFVSGHLSRLPLGPGQNVAFVPGPTVGGSTRDKRPNPFIPGGNTNRDKRVTHPFVPDKRPLHVIVQKEVILY